MKADVSPCANSHVLLYGVVYLTEKDPSSCLGASSGVPLSSSRFLSTAFARQEENTPTKFLALPLSHDNYKLLRQRKRLGQRT